MSMNMRSVGAYAAAIMLGATLSVAFAAAPASAGCSYSHTDRDPTSGNLFDGSYVNIRTGPHLACGVVGQGQLSHFVKYWCFTPFGDSVTRNGNTLQSWTYLTDTTLGVSGWVSDLYLDNWGSSYYC